MNGICWNRIVGAAARRLVAMPGESAGYLALGVIDAMGAQPGRVVGEDIRLGDDGRVVLLRVLPSDAGASDQCMRELLRTLLDASSSPSPALVRIAYPSAKSSGSTFSAELQTALIPVNRGAARRALARLHRELLRLAPVAAETPESLPIAEQRIPAVPSFVCDEADAKAASDVEELECYIPSVARIDSLEASVEDAVVVSPPALPAKYGLSEIPDLVLPVSPVAPTELESSERSALENADCSADIEARGETLLIRSVVTVAAQASGDALVTGEESDGENADASSGSAVRETTLMLAPVAPKPRIEQTQRLDVQSNVARLGAKSVIDGAAPLESLVQEPTIALPLVTLKRRAPAHGESVQGSSCDAVPMVTPEVSEECAEALSSEEVNSTELQEPSEPSSCDAVAMVAPEMSGECAECRNREAPALAEQAAECPKLPERREHCYELTDAEANVVSPSWDATSMDAVVEISDDEIVYEQVLEEDIWLDVDCSDDDLFEAVAPRVVMFEHGAAFAGRVAAEDAGEVFVVADVSSIVTAAESPDCSCDDSTVEVDDAELLVMDDAGDDVSDCCFEASRKTDDSLASPGVVRGEPTTLYRSDGLAIGGPRSTLEGLSGQFSAEPTWTQGELCRSLRVVAGLDLSPIGPRVETQTPPPTVETVLRECSEQSEPTRRLRRVGSIVAVLVVVGAGAHGVRVAGGSMTSAAQLSVDALGQICRATVTVGGVDSGQHIRIRQVGDLQFRAPTSVANATARFAGLRCGQDTELLVHDVPDVGVRRIPISGDRLQPRDTHPWANVTFHLDGPT